MLAAAGQGIQEGLEQRRLLSGIILAFAALLSRASAFQRAGAYERVWYYYAYLADVQLGQGTAPVIAPGCVKVMGTGGKPRSFNQFMAYIDGQKQPFSLTTDQMPDVEIAADLLEPSEHTGAYETEYIHKKAIPQDFADLIVKVGEYLSSTVLFAVDDATIKSSIQHALTAVARTRMSASMGFISSALENRGLIAKWENVPLFEGANEEVQILDTDATVKA